MITRSNKKDGKETAENKQIEEEVRDSLEPERRINKFEFKIPRASDIKKKFYN